MKDEIVTNLRNYDARSFHKEKQLFPWKEQEAIRLLYTACVARSAGISPRAWDEVARLAVQEYKNHKGFLIPPLFCHWRIAKQLVVTDCLAFPENKNKTKQNKYVIMCGQSLWNNKKNSLAGDFIDNRDFSGLQTVRIALRNFILISDIWWIIERCYFQVVLVGTLLVSLGRANSVNSCNWQLTLKVRGFK